MVTWRAPKYPANPFKKATSSPPPPEGSGTIRGAWSSASAPKNIWPNGGPSGRPQASAGRMRARAARLTTVKSARREDEAGPFAGDLDADRDDRRNRSQAGLVEAQKAGGLAPETVGRELGCRFAIQVQPEGVGEGEPPARSPDGELDPPGAHETVHTQERECERVIHWSSRSSRPAGR